MAKRSIPPRSKIPPELTWDLSDIFESDEDWRREYEALMALPESIGAYRGSLGGSARALLDWFRLQDDISVRLGKLMVYAGCKNDEDTSLGLYQDMRSRSVAAAVAITSSAAFAAPEIMAIPAATLDAFLQEEPGLKPYGRSLYQLRRRAAHILSPECETLLAAAGEMAEAPDNIAGIFRSADLKFPRVVDSAGVTHQLTDSSFVPLLESDDPPFRKQVFDTYYRRLGEFKNTVAAALDAQFKQLNFFSRARKYASGLEASLDETEVPAQVYHKLIEAVHDGLDEMYRYVRLRKRLMQVDRLHMWDVYTPIVRPSRSSVSYDQACATVREALAVLGEDYISILDRGLQERWIDVCENIGKRSGAYSTGGARPHPYVLLNYKDNLDSQFTLAHEMGHALHSYLSCRSQPVCTSDYVIFVAEVASTCNEVLLMRHLLDRTQDRDERIYLINHFLDQFKGTVYRQTMFAEFELEMGRLSESGQTLTADLLCEKYLALNKLYFGPDMVSDQGIALEWARIPHFFYNYYVFQYATGFSAAVAIANRILSGRPDAVEDYLRFLSGGSSQDPISLLKLAGVDMGTPEPVKEALALFGRLLDELEELTGE